MKKPRDDAQLLRVRRLHRSTAAVIRAEFIMARRRAHERQTGLVSKYIPPAKYDGGRTPHSQLRYNKPIWPEIAAFVLANRLEPRAFVERQFRFHDRPSLLNPDQMLGKAALARYERGEKQTAAEIKLAFTIQKRRLLAEWHNWQELAQVEELEALRMALVDESAALSALFRYCVAKRERMADLARLFYLDAVVQYLRHADHYDKLWGDWLPEDFRPRAEKFYRRILSET